MPAYIYKHPKKNKTIEIIQGMNDLHEYIDEKGIKWERVYDSPNAQVSSISKLNPFDKQGFVELTKNKKGNMGNLFDLSKSLSEQRESKTGQPDKVKENFKKSWSKNRKGKKYID